MEAKAQMSERRRQMLVGQTHKLLAEGFTASEIAEKLNIPESSARAFVKICEEADAIRSAQK